MNTTNKSIVLVSIFFTLFEQKLNVYQYVNIWYIESLFDIPSIFYFFFIDRKHHIYRDRIYYLQEVSYLIDQSP